VSGATPDPSAFIVSISPREEPILLPVPLALMTLMLWPMARRGHQGTRELPDHRARAS
jgi:hypothetical protein